MRYENGEAILSLHETDYIMYLCTQQTEYSELTSAIKQRTRSARYDWAVGTEPRSAEIFAENSDAQLLTTAVAMHNQSDKNELLVPVRYTRDELAYLGKLTERNLVVNLLNAGILEDRVDQIIRQGDEAAEEQGYPSTTKEEADGIKNAMFELDLLRLSIGYDILRGLEENRIYSTE